MKLKRIYHRLDESPYPSKGNAFVPRATLSHDEYGFNSFILVTGRSHLEVISQAGRFLTAHWEYDVDYERDAEKQIGLEISIRINGYLTNDNQPPDISWAGLVVTLEQTCPGQKMLYELNRQSNKQSGGVSENEEIIIKPLLPHPSELRLELNTTCNVVLDRHPSSRADHESTIDIILKPFMY